MSRKFDSVFQDEDDKAYMTFEVRNCGKTVRIDNTYNYDVTWNEILEDVVQCLEGSYGYSFNLDEFSIYTGEKNERSE